MNKEIRELLDSIITCPHCGQKSFKSPKMEEEWKEFTDKKYEYICQICNGEPFE